jgi:hypothetical protein
VEWTVPDFFSTQELIQAFEPAFTPALFKRSPLVVGLGGNGTHLALAAVRTGFALVVGSMAHRRASASQERACAAQRPSSGRRSYHGGTSALR